MPSIILTEKKGIFYEQPGRGEILVLHVSPSTQRENFRDLQGNETAQEVATRAGMPDSIPLWRYLEGRVVLYGFLSPDIAGRTQAATVWLPEDLAPKDCTVFYYIFGGTWVVHGHKEVDEENITRWRVTAIRSKDNREIVELVRNSINDQLLVSENCRPCVAVSQDAALMEKLGQELAPLGQKPMPFEALKPVSGVKPLFRQRNNTLLFLTLLFVMILAACATATYWFLGAMDLRKINREIENLQHEIQSIQINEEIGHIREPEPILNVVKTRFEQQPSAVMDAAARFGALFGELESVDFSMPETETSRFRTAEANPLGKGEYMVGIVTGSTDKKMLVAQEEMTHDLVSHMPWIRQVENQTPQGSKGLSLQVIMQVEDTGRRNGEGQE